MKIFIAVLIAIVFIFAIINTGGNTSTTENVLDLAKTSDNMAKIVSAIDVAGDSVFNNVQIDVSGSFKGEVEQVPSLATATIKKHQIRVGVDLDYSAAKEKVTLIPNTGKLFDIRLPVSARGDGSNLTLNTKGLNRAEYSGDGIPPVIKDPAKSVEWIKQFLFSESGVGLKRLSSYTTTWNALETNTATQLKLMEWIIGNKNATGTVNWLDYKVDRIVALRQIDVEALTGIDRNNRTISTILDPNRAYLYEVFNVNMTNFAELKTSLTSVGLTIDASIDTNVFMYDLARHLNQMLGGRILVIPNNDSSMIIDTDGNPVFFLN